jgi:hypothetical protein
MADESAQVFSQISALPPDQNRAFIGPRHGHRSPHTAYEWLLQYIWHTASLSSPIWSVWSLYATAGVLAVCFLVCLWALWLRYKQGTLWWFRWAETSRGRVLLPNTSALFTTLSTTYCPLAIYSVTYFGP